MADITITTSSFGCPAPEAGQITPFQDTLPDQPLPVNTQNITTKFREAFETYSPTGGKWAETRASGDIISLEGNAAAASYLTISKDPLSAGGVSTIETIATFDMPLEMAVGLHTSQRTLGQELFVEMVSAEASLPTPADLAISSIQQATTTLTVNTTLPHGLKPGVRVGIRDCVDSRMNYPALVVATAPTATQFTCTTQPGSTIPSVTAGPFASGFVFYRSAMGFAPNGTSMVLDAPSATRAAFYVRSESGDALSSGTPNGDQTVTGLLTTASSQAINSAFTYSFQPPTEYRLTQLVDGIQWSDTIVDSIGVSGSRYKRVQVVPDISHQYKLRFRATNNPSLTRPNAQIVSAVKSGSTTATITTDVPHGLTTADVIVVYGIRAQGASEFPNLLTASGVASIVSPTVFTVVIGTSGTVTSYGGFVARVNGGNLMSTLGASAVVAQSIARTANILTVTGNASWTGLVIGDFVNLVGCRDNATGASLGIDGAYRVANVVTTALTLEPINATVSPTGGDIVSTNCGGAIIKRTCLRLSYVRVMDFERQRVEMLARPGGDASTSAPVSVQNTPSVTIASGTVTTVSTVTAVTTAGTPAAPTPTSINSAASTNGQLINGASTGLQAFYATNIGATVAFVKLYNKVTAPTVGTDVPVMIIPVPAAVSGVPGVSPAIDCGFNGHRFALGLGLAITGLVADSDTTAVAAGQVKVHLARTA